MKTTLILITLTALAAYAHAAGTTNADGTTVNPVQELLNDMAKVPVEQADRFNHLAEQLVGHLVGPPVILATPDNELMDNERFPGLAVPEQFGGPRQTPEDAQDIFQAWCDMVDQAIETLNRFEGNASQREAAEFLHKAADVAKNLHELINAGALTLRDNQEIEISNAARLPFRLGVRGVPEASYQGEIPKDGSAFVLKEFLGLKLTLVRRPIPIWQEAWYSRRRIIGYRWVYYLQWTPCEYLKSILYHDTDNGVVPRVHTRQHCDRALLSYWAYPSYQLR